MTGLKQAASADWVKTIGIYLIVLLAVARFLIYPLHSVVKDREAAVTEQCEQNRIRTRALEQSKQERKEDMSRDISQMLSSLYPSEIPIQEIQTEMLTSLRELSESKGMSVTGFEMPEAMIGKKITEVPVVIRLKGQAASLRDLLKNIRNVKTMAIRTMEISATGRELTVSLTLRALRLGS